MQMLRTSFEGYFSCGELQTYDNWILNPFMQNLEDVSGIKEDLIDLRHNREIQMEFTNSQLEHFWASQLEAYPALAKKALEVLVPFATTYLKEKSEVVAVLDSNNPKLQRLIAQSPASRLTTERHISQTSADVAGKKLKGFPCIQLSP
ncbi:protein FAM200C-like [Tachypleus tridentatus]|uniref:protein FAM200C-like n=1 Tax=Tachypleus tridentatus TaxID=6853 RepID=UPI003FD29ED0